MELKREITHQCGYKLRMELKREITRQCCYKIRMELKREITHQCCYKIRMELKKVKIVRKKNSYFRRKIIWGKENTDFNHKL